MTVETKEKPARAFSTEYSDHIGLINMFARKGHYRLASCGVHIDIEDIVQLMSETFVKAKAKYDPERGVTFTAYLGAAIWNEFNRFAEKEVNNPANDMTGRFEIDAEADGRGAVAFLERIPDETTVSPYQRVENLQEAIVNLRKLSKLARFFLSEIISPSETLEKYIRAQRSKEEVAKQVNVVNPRMGSDTTFRQIARCYQVPEKVLVQVRREFKDIYGF